jgi:catechol 2,3-dioxygenase-like lactoylglutathione lyase family enzyme
MRNDVDMIDHLGINCEDIDAAKRFYDTVLGVLGHGRIMEYGDFVGYGSDGKPDFWIGRYENMPPQREVHIAFEAPDAATVRAFHEAAVGLGAEVLHEPRMWPEYHECYYGAFVRDPDGNNVEAVCHRAAEGD